MYVFGQYITIMTEDQKLMCSIQLQFRVVALHLPSGMFPSESGKQFQANIYLFKNH